MMAVAGHACCLPIGFSLLISPARHKRTGQSHAVHTDTQSFDTRRSLDAWMRTTHPLVVECCTVVHHTGGGSHSCGSHRWGISNHAASPPRWGNHKKCMSPSLRNSGCRTWGRSNHWAGRGSSKGLNLTFNDWQSPHCQNPSFTAWSSWSSSKPSCADSWCSSPCPLAWTPGCLDAERMGGGNAGGGVGPTVGLVYFDVVASIVNGVLDEDAWSPELLDEDTWMPELRSRFSGGG